MLLVFCLQSQSRSNPWDMSHLSNNVQQRPAISKPLKPEIAKRKKWELNRFGRCYLYEAFLNFAKLVAGFGTPTATSLFITCNAISWSFSVR